jgi:hypothetical protein
MTEQIPSVIETGVQQKTYTRNGWFATLAETSRFGFEGSCVFGVSSGSMYLGGCSPKKLRNQDMRSSGNLRGSSACDVETIQALNSMEKNISGFSNVF